MPWISQRRAPNARWYLPKNARVRSGDLPVYALPSDGSNPLPLHAPISFAYTSLSHSRDPIQLRSRRRLYTLLTAFLSFSFHLQISLTCVLVLWPLTGYPRACLIPLYAFISLNLIILLLTCLLSSFSMVMSDSSAVRSMICLFSRSPILAVLWTKCFAMTRAETLGPMPKKLFRAR